MKIICIGQAAYDVTLPLNHFPIENKKVRVKDKIECGGGSASNCAYLLAKWGIETYFAGVIGDDYYGSCIEKEFKEVGVNTKYLEKSKKYQTTSSYIIANTTDGTRTILTSKDKDMKMTDRDTNDKFDIILLDGYESEFAKKVMKKNPKAIKILDAGSITMKDEITELAHLVDYVVCSKDYAEDFTKKKIDYTDLKTLISVYNDLRKTFRNNIVITLEDKGCFTYDNGYKIAPTLKKRAVDSTGAGDIYHGAFAYCIANNFEMIKTLKISNIAGALSVEKIGGRFSIPTLEETMKVYDEYGVSK